jgi:chromate transporter
MTSPADQTQSKDRERGTASEVLLIFLRLGLTCSGGPIAHIGYFRDEFVIRRRWLDEQA